VRLGTIADLIADPWSEPESSTVAKLRLELTGEAEKDVAFVTLVISAVARRVLDHPHPDRPKVSGARYGGSGLAGMLGRLDRRPVRGAKRDIGELHVRAWSGRDGRMSLAALAEAAKESYKSLRRSRKQSRAPLAASPFVRWPPRDVDLASAGQAARDTQTFRRRRRVVAS